MDTKPRLIRLPEVVARTGLRKSAIYQRAKDGTFPSSIKIGTYNVAWLESEIDEWVAERIATSRRTNAPLLGPAPAH